MARLIPAQLEQRHTDAVDRVSEIVKRHPANKASRAAYYRDLIAAKNDLATIYTEASNLHPIGAGLLWSALFAASMTLRFERDELKSRLAELESTGTQDGTP